MLDILFQPIFTDTFTAGTYLICTLTSLVLGGVIAWATGRRSGCSKSLILTLLLLPAAVQTVIMMVNGSIGTGVAVMGAFSLIRFRSAPGSAREIISIFLAMAAGLAAAVGYIGVAVVFTVIVCAVILVASALGPKASDVMDMKITIPESLNYAHAFDDLFDMYTLSAKLVSTKTTDMGSLYRLHYKIELKDMELERDFINDLRCRNGNLEIVMGYAPEGQEAL